MASRVTQHGLEVLTATTATARVTQVTLEVLTYSAPGARWTQAALEVASTTTAPVRLTAHGLEVLRVSVEPTVLPRFPAPLAFGATGGPGFSTDVVLLRAGQEQRNVNWAEALCRWDVGSMHRTQEEMRVLVEFFHVVEGQEGLFLFRDFTDDTFDTALGTGDGTQTTWPLVKRYTVGPYTRERRLTHPIAESVSVRLDGVLVSGWALDDSTGALTFATAPGAGVVVSAAGTFEVVCRFTQDHLPIERVAPNVYSCGQIELTEVRT